MARPPTSLKFVPAFLSCLWLAWLAPAIERPAPTIERWEPKFQGIDVAAIHSDAPRLMQGLAMRIDLRKPGIEFLATPPNGEREGETDGLKTSTFLERYRLQAAVNAAPFKPVRNEEGLPEDVCGLMISQGELVSPEEQEYPGLLITRDNRVTIGEAPFKTEGIENAVCGFKIVLRGGAIIEGDEKIHPRTAAGLTADGRTLYLLTIDGRQPGWSEGATTGEVAAWLAVLGATEGINLDGGGTTTMVVEDEAGKPSVLNRPIHLNMPGNQRPSASHLGIKANRIKHEEHKEK